MHKELNEDGDKQQKEAQDETGATSNRPEGFGQQSQIAPGGDVASGDPFDPEGSLETTPVGLLM
jgi:hypothetical protein